MTVSSISLGVTHRIAWCDVCSERWEWHKTAARMARAHTKLTGHKTVVEAATLREYRRAAL